MNDPFEALRALRDTLPEGEEPKAEAPATPKIAPKIAYERKGRGGKEVTIVYGLEALSDSQLQDLAKRLKSALAVGGSARNGEILLQGDQRNRLPALLSKFLR